MILCSSRLEATTAELSPPRDLNLLLAIRNLRRGTLRDGARGLLIRLLVSALLLIDRLVLVLVSILLINLLLVRLISLDSARPVVCIVLGCFYGWL